MCLCWWERGVGRGVTNSNSYTSKFYKHHRTPKFFCYIAERLSLGANTPSFSPTRWSEKCRSIRIFKANFKLIRLLVAVATLLGDASCETRAKALSLKAALQKPGVTYAVCLIGRYSALMEPLTRNL